MCESGFSLCLVEQLYIARKSELQMHISKAMPRIDFCSFSKFALGSKSLGFESTNLLSLAWKSVLTLENAEALRKG